MIMFLSSTNSLSNSIIYCTNNIENGSIMPSTSLITWKTNIKLQTTYNNYNFYIPYLNSQVQLESNIDTIFCDYNIQPTRYVEISPFTNPLSLYYVQVFSNGNLVSENKTTYLYYSSDYKGENMSSVTLINSYNNLTPIYNDGPHPIRIDLGQEYQVDKVVIFNTQTNSIFGGKVLLLDTNLIPVYQLDITNKNNTNVIIVNNVGWNIRGNRLITGDYTCPSSKQYNLFTRDFSKMENGSYVNTNLSCPSFQGLKPVLNKYFQEREKVLTQNCSYIDESRVTNCYTNQTQKYDNLDQLYLLSNISCKNNELLTRITPLSDSNNKYFYEYNCCSVSGIQNPKVYNDKQDYYSAAYVDRQRPFCPTNQALQTFTRPISNGSYSWTCVTL